MKKAITVIVIVFSITCLFATYSFACSPSLNSNLGHSYDWGTWLPFDDAQAHTEYWTGGHTCYPNDYYFTAARTTLYYYDDNGNLHSVTNWSGNHYESHSDSYVVISGYDYAYKIEHKGWIKCDYCGDQKTVLHTHSNEPYNIASSYGEFKRY
ncbi:MAG: hypothetical protein WC677_01695 [Clostridia bacterium]|jgi:hypothetical protein